MKKFILAILIFVLVSTAASAISYTPVEDNAGALNSDAINMIYDANDSVNPSTGGQIFVLTHNRLPSGYEYADEYANWAFNEIGIGDASKNNGLLLYFTVDDGKVWLVQGAGMTGFDADALLEKYFYAEFDRGNYSQAVMSIMPQLVKTYGKTLVSGNNNNNGGNSQPVNPPAPANNSNSNVGFFDVIWSFVSGIFTFVLWVVIILVIIFLCVASGRRRTYMGSTYYIRTDPRPRWWHFMPGYYGRSRYYHSRRDYYSHRPPPRPRNGGYGGPARPNNRPSGGNSFWSGGSGGRSGGSSSSFWSSGGGGRSSGGGGGRSSGFGGGGRSSGGGGGRSSGGGGRSSGGGGGRR
ncbi:MAG: TPM domain-containing protein [Oscillospiraceae bacterium]|jgi:uncharacterized membrane protein YgcG|nr:TPM domain-containing protein [Oscillospiraceae bacterium]